MWPKITAIYYDNSNGEYYALSDRDSQLVKESHELAVMSITTEMESGPAGNMKIYLIRNFHDKVIARVPAWKVTTIYEKVKEGS